MRYTVKIINKRKREYIVFKELRFNNGNRLRVYIKNLLETKELSFKRYSLDVVGVCSNSLTVVEKIVHNYKQLATFLNGIEERGVITYASKTIRYVQ
jgi:hypothetical protein